MSTKQQQNAPAKPGFILRHVEFGRHVKWVIMRLGSRGYEPVVVFDSLREAIQQLVQNRSQTT